MVSRRRLAAQLGMGALASMSPELLYAQRAVRMTEPPQDTVWLNANENPLGPPEAALAAMRDALPGAGRYRFQEIRAFHAALAASEGVSAENIVVGAGSSEVLQVAVEAFTSADRPLITAIPTFELPVDTARAAGRKCVTLKLRADGTPDVRTLAEEAGKARGGLVYLCNPHNPTSAIVKRGELKWLVENLPPGTVLLVDEAYIHFGESPELESALSYVRQGKDVVVARTFSKIYGMAGMRVGFAVAPPGLAGRMRSRRGNPISFVSIRGALAALAARKEIPGERRAALARTRRELCAWLKEREVRYLEPHANFVMIEVGRGASEFGGAMSRLGVVPGRAFPPLDNLLRVTIGTDAEMAKFREVFWKVYRG